MPAGSGPLATFTPQARQALALAQQEARLLGHDYLGTEHILLGLLAQDEGAARRLLERAGASAERARVAIRAIIGRGSEQAVGPLRLTPRAKTVLLLASAQARRSPPQEVGSLHLLLGLLKERKGVAVELLQRLGLRQQQIERQVERQLQGPGS